MTSESTTPDPTPAVAPAHEAPTTAPQDGMTRSEERLSLTSEVVAHRRAVLRVQSTTEQVMVPVTLTRQHAWVEYVDIDPATAIPADDLPRGAPTSGGSTGWLTLTADEPVVGTHAVPTERVRLVTHWVTSAQDVHTPWSHEVVTTEVVTPEVEASEASAVPTPPDPLRLA